MATLEHLANLIKSARAVATKKLGFFIKRLKALRHLDSEPRSFPCGYVLVEIRSRRMEERCCSHAYFLLHGSTRQQGMQCFVVNLYTCPGLPFGKQLKALRSGFVLRFIVPFHADLSKALSNLSKITAKEKSLVVTCSVKLT